MVFVAPNWLTASLTLEYILSPSTTSEEANCSWINWIHQRSRWMKGYMQTYLVHMRKPLQLVKQLGITGFGSFQLFIGGVVFTALASLVLWAIFIISLVVPKIYIHDMFRTWLVQIGWANLILGNVMLMMANLIAACKRRMYVLIWVVPLTPIYWIFVSIAAYVGLYELIVRPTYWYKTTHGLSKEMEL